MNTGHEAWAGLQRRSRAEPVVGPAALFALVAVVMGVGYVVVRVGVTSAPPLLLAALRFDLTAAVLLAVGAATGRALVPRTRADLAAVAVLGVLVFGGAIGLLFLGQQHTTAAVAAVGMCLGPVLTALLAGLLVPGERLSRRGAAGVVLGLAGAVLVARSGAVGVGPVTGVGAGFGAVLVVSAAASGSLGGVLLARLRATAPLTTQAGWGAALGGLVLHAASLWAGEPAGGVVWTPALVGVLLYLSVVVGGVGYVTLLALIRTVGPTRTSFASYASPLVTVLVGLVVLGEPVTSGVVTGFLSILAGFLLVNGVGPGAPDTAGQG